MQELRIIEVKNNNEWVGIDFSELKNGDIFRMFESTGEPVIGSNNELEFLAISDLYFSEKHKQIVIDIAD